MLPPQDASRIAVVGAGRWGLNHVRTLHGIGWLHAVVEPDPARREALAAEFPGIRLLDVDDLNALADAPPDGVVIAAPAALHLPLARRTLGMGLHTLVEKPLALDAAGGRELLALAAARGVVLGVGHLLEYHPARLALQALVDTGRLGRLRTLRMVRTNLGTVRTEENVLQSFAPHDLSTALGLAGERPVRAWARGVAAIGRVEDTVAWHLEFPSGLSVQGTASWMEPVKEHRLVAVGDRGMAIWDDTPGRRGVTFYPVEVVRGEAPRLTLGAAPAGEEIPVGDETPLEGELRAFAAACKGAPLPTDGAQGVAVLEIMDALMDSLSAGRTVEP
ncbi:MAG: Gfo/Idh/MocA family oxidoreductase [Pseudomonadota bacterium]